MGSFYKNVLNIDSYYSISFKLHVVLAISHRLKNIVTVIFSFLLK